MRRGLRGAADLLRLLRLRLLQQPEPGAQPRRRVPALEGHDDAEHRGHPVAAGTQREFASHRISALFVRCQCREKM